MLNDIIVCRGHIIVWCLTRHTPDIWNTFNV